LTPVYPSEYRVSVGRFTKVTAPTLLPHHSAIDEWLGVGVPKQAPRLPNEPLFVSWVQKSGRSLIRIAVWGVSLEGGVIQKLRERQTGQNKWTDEQHM